MTMLGIGDCRVAGNTVDGDDSLGDEATCSTFSILEVEEVLSTNFRIAILLATEGLSAVGLSGNGRGVHPEEICFMSCIRAFVLGRVIFTF